MNFLKALFTPFPWKTALRDARPQWRRLLLYTSSIIAGVAALVAILSFRSDIYSTVQDQSRELLGADLELESNSPLPDSLQAVIDTLNVTQALSIEFSSMVIYGKDGQTRLSQIRGVEGGFPFYGSLETRPLEAAGTYQKTNGALVEQTAMVQFGLEVGDSVKVGAVTLPITGELLSVPGEAAAFALIGPRVFVPAGILKESQLLQRGSRLEYKNYLKLNEGANIQQVIETIRPAARANRVDIDTVESRQRQFARIVDNLSNFLGLIGLIALLLGGLGVASAMYVYIKKKMETIGTMRCLGVASSQITAVFIVQVSVIAIAGSLAGALSGVGIQYYLPTFFTDFLPFEINQSISYTVVAGGVLLGVVTSLGFSVLPIAGATRISPMVTLRKIDQSPLSFISSKSKIIFGISAFLITSVAIGLILDNFLSGIVFSAALVASTFILFLIAILLMNVIKSLRLRQFSYIWRQGAANLFRPNNQTGMLTATIGMGVLLISILYLSQHMIVNTIDMELGDNAPNLVFYDIQSDQNQGVVEIIKDENAELLQNAPIVSIRLQSLRGRPVSEIRNDTARTVSRWALTREYRVTYRNELRESETLIEGEWIGTADGIDSVVPISPAKRIAEDLELAIGDSLTFDVQGVPVNTVVASIREVDFQRPEPNFFILFPEGVLEPAPQFYATVLRAESSQSSQKIQQKVVSAYPNVSALDLGIVLKSIREFLDKISIAIEFMAFFTIITGFIVLISSLSLSKNQRIQESVLLRTLGAGKTQVSGIQTVEYLLLGILASATGLILSVGGSYLLASFYFDIEYIPDYAIIIYLSAAVITSILLLGWFGNRSIYKQTPLEILRIEAT